MPGHTAAGDQTDYLRMGGFWPSYNIPFFKSIYDISGNAAAADQFGPDKSYELAPRAKIFRRDAPLVNSFWEYKAEFKRISRKFTVVKYGNRNLGLISKFGQRSKI